MNGLDEDAQEFRRPVELVGGGRFRSIAGIGPIYEIVGIGEATVQIRFIDSDETLDYPIADAERDPVA